MLDRRTVLLALTAVAAAPAALAQAAPPMRIRGKIVGFDGQMLTVAARDGARLEIRFADSATVGALRRMDLSAITPGSFIGTAAEPGPDGQLRALEVLVFPEAMRGTGEGHYPWDLAPNSTMTNATVEAVVTKTAGRELNLVFQGRSVAVHVPPATPIVTPIPATRADLVAGAQVFLSATRDSEGKLTAARVTVEKDGVAPPM
ncbi:hypothetical protein E8M01_03550 [Phreatobacter stygius]|uniref:DUF5666 domain-containing protein n=2 Tax=Phreatobacter stygius TaxID=1940610 RepID=A0A4D7BMZ7_9HYPH|nr:hypothetical protein E8M01_03550 [Phreatobacter stygius]